MKKPEIMSPAGYWPQLRTAIEALLAAPGRLEGYVNPRKQQIASLDAQAGELLGFLKAASVS